jgi:hypothetical protein
MRSKFEIKCEKELKEQGWLVDTKAGMNRWSKNNDYFHLFDIVAVRPGDPIRWIAIKGQGGVPSALVKGIKEFWLPEGNVKEIWHYRKLKGYGNKFIPKKKII